MFYEFDFHTNNPLVPFSLSSAHGDEVYLSEADPAGNLTGYQANALFDAAENGVSFGRYETSVGTDFPPLLQRTFGADTPGSLAEFRTGTGLPNAAPLLAPVVINEVMYHPPDIGGTNDDTLEEFVELHNRTLQPVRFFDPLFPTNTWRLRDAVSYAFPLNTTLAPGEGCCW